MKINPLTPAEEQLMQVIWTLKSPFTKEILEAYPEPKPHPNTVSTFLKILVEKDYLSTEKVGRIFRYNALISSEDYKKNLLHQFLERYFDGSASSLLSYLMEEQLLSSSDLKSYSGGAASETLPHSYDNEIRTFIDELTSDKKKKKKKKGKKKSKE